MKVDYLGALIVTVAVIALALVAFLVWGMFS